MSLSTHLKNTIDKESALSIFKDMQRIRKMEEESARLYTEEKIRGFLHLYIGEEAIASTIIPLLEKGDQIFATYREHAHALIRGVSMKKIFAEMFGKKTGCSKGRGGSMHLFDTSHAFYGGNAIVAGHVPLAVGVALANKMQKNNLISVCFFGEGAIAEGVFHESINIASLWKLPILFICENNYYAMGTSLERSESQVNLIKKIKSYEIEAVRVNGMSTSHLYEASQLAIDYVRTKQTPYFLECETYRFRAHSMFDPELYRSKEEVTRWKKSDPIDSLKKLLFELNWLTEDQFINSEKEIESEVSQAIAYAQSAEAEDISEALKNFIDKDKNGNDYISSSTS